MDMTIYRRVIRELGPLQFNVGTPASIAAAILINEKLPVVDYHDRNALHAHWAVDLHKIVHAEIESIAKKTICDKTMTMEMTRKIYFHRCLIASDPLFILFNILSPSNYKERGGDFEDAIYHDEFVYNQAFYYIIEIVHTNRKQILTYFSDFNYDKSSNVMRNQIVDKIYETFDGNLKKVPAKTMQLYHSIINKVITDLFDLYKINHKWYRVTEKKGALLIQDQIETIMDGTIQIHQLAAFINCFYDSQVIDPEYSKREDKELILKVRETDQIEEAYDAESYHTVGFDTNQLDSWLGDASAKYDGAHKLWSTLHEEGACRADAIMILGLDPVKDFTELSKYPIERDGTHTEVQAFLGRALRKAGRAIITMAVRFVEAILNNIAELLGKPFGLEPKFILTESSKMVHEWGKNFNKAIHELIENKDNVFVAAPEDVKRVLIFGLHALSDYLEIITDAGEKFDRTKNQAELVKDHDLLNQDGILAIATFDRMFGQEHLFGIFVKDLADGINHDAEHGEEFMRDGPISSLVNSQKAMNAVQSAANATVNRRQLTEGIIDGFRSRLKAAEVYEDINDEVSDVAKSAKRKVSKLRAREYDFLSAPKNPADPMLDMEFVKTRTSFRNHIEAARDMSRAINYVARMFYVLNSEAASMSKTLEANKK